MSEFRRPGLVPLQYKYNHTPYINKPSKESDVDTTAVTTTSLTRVTLKTYTAASGSAKGRIRVFAHTYASGSDTTTQNVYIWVNINGTDVTYYTNTDANWLNVTAKTLLIDWVGGIPSGATIKIDAQASVASGTFHGVSLDEVDIIYGVALLNSTTEVSLLTQTLSYTESGVDNLYIKAGDKVPTCYLRIHRKTTAAATLKFDGSTNSPAAANDGASVVTVQIDGTHLNTTPLNVTLSGYVGASGDYILIVSVQMAVRHTYKHLDNINPSWYENVYILYPNALFYIVAMKYSFFLLDGSSKTFSLLGASTDATYYTYWYTTSANISGTTPDYNVVENGGIDIPLTASDTVSILQKLEVSVAVAK
jgi:hypothetical protein